MADRVRARRGPGRGARASCSRRSDSFGALLRFETGSSGAGIGGWAFVVVALLVLLIAGGDDARWAARWWGIALLAWLLAALPAWLGSASPDPEGVLVPAALAVAILAGLGDGELPRRDPPHRSRLAAGRGAGGRRARGALGLRVRRRHHRRPLPPAVGRLARRAVVDEPPARPRSVPGAVGRRPRHGARLPAGGRVPTATCSPTRARGISRDALPPPGGAGARGRARRGARAPDAGDAAVRPPGRADGGALRGADRADRARARTTPTPSPFGPALGEQLDLRELQSQPGARVYENTAWVPGDAVVAGRVPAVDRDRAARCGHRPDRRAPAGAGHGAVVAAVRRRVGGDELGAGPCRTGVPFGWANAFTATRRRAGLGVVHRSVVALAAAGAGAGDRRAARPSDPAAGPAAVGGAAAARRRSTVPAADAEVVS